MTDCLIVGGGVVGLSIAYELSRRGLRVQVLERSAVGTEASWAGAGVLPDAALRPADSSYLQLGGLSHAMHRTWAAALREETGIDTGYEVCGELHISDRAEIERVEAELAGCDVTSRVEWYPGTHHGFAFPGRGKVYDKAAAERHWSRLHSLFDRNLKG